MSKPSSWVRRLFARPTAPARRVAPPRRLVAELLEAREVPAVLTVNSPADNTTADDQLTLREAVAVANGGVLALGRLLTIGELAQVGTFPGNGQADQITFALPANTTVALDPALGPIRLTDPARTTIDGGAGVTVSGGDATRLVQVDAGAVATLTHLTLTGGRAGGNNRGGAVWNAGDLTVAVATVTGNRADDGGGFFNSGTLTVVDSTVSDNTAGQLTSANNGSPGKNGGNAGGSGFIGGYGGAVYNAGTLTVRTSRLTGNRALGGNGGDGGQGRGPDGAVLYGGAGGAGGAGIGGAIYSDGGTVSVTGVTLSGNQAVGGDGGSSYTSYLNNTAAVYGGDGGDSGGGFGAGGHSYQADYGGNAGGGFGGAVFMNGGAFTAVASTFAGNAALTGNMGIGITNRRDLGGDLITRYGDSGDGQGGGVYLNGGSHVVRRSTFSGNLADSGVRLSSGGGLYIGGAVADIADSTFTGNNSYRGRGIYAEVGDGPASVALSNSLLGQADVGNTDFQAQSGVTTSGVGNWIGRVYGFAGQVVGTADPRLAPLGDYGGPTPTCGLLSSSPLIGARVTPGGVDQRGFARPATGGDIGAFENRGFTLTLAGGDDQTAADTTAFAAPLAARVTTPAGDPVGNVYVVYTGPGSGASATPRPAERYTAADGTAAGVLSANGVAGRYTVTADSVDTANTVAFRLRNRVTPLVTAVPPSQTTYTGQPLPATAVLTGAGGPAATLEGVAPQLSYSLDGTLFLNTPPSNAGTYTVVAVFPGSESYAAAQSAPVTYAIAQAAPTLTPPAGGVYTGNPFAATVTIAGLDGVSGGSLQGVAPVISYSAPPVSAGTYTATATFPGSGNYKAATATATFTIGRATPTVTLTPPASGPYTGQPFVATATVAGVSGVPGATLEGAGLNIGYLSAGALFPVSTPPTAAGTYIVSVGFLGNPLTTDYATAGASATFTISPAVLTVAADANPATPAADGFVKTYGQADPAFTYRATGFVGTDTAASVLTGALARAPGESAGVYAVTQGTLATANPNYTIAFTPGTLTVRQAVATLTLAASAAITVPGLAVTFTATVGPATATGTVTFRDGTTVLRTVPLVGGLARLTTDALQYGTHAVTATYSGDANDTAPPPAGVTETVVPAAILPDRLNPGQNALFVGGTPAADLITVCRAGTDKYAVGILSFPAGQCPTAWGDTFAGPISRVVVYGGDGNDGIAVDAAVTKSAWLYGGAGNDILLGGGGNDVLLGGAGNDLLTARGGSDILIGGTGSDALIGATGGELMIGGSTAFDANETALLGVQLEWTSARTFEQRVANLRGTGTGPRANGDFVLKASGPGQTVFDDGATDLITGGCGRDWMFAKRSGAAADVLIGLSGSDLVDDLV